MVQVSLIMDPARYTDEAKQSLCIERVPTAGQNPTSNKYLYYIPQDRKRYDIVHIETRCGTSQSDDEIWISEETRRVHRLDFASSISGGFHRPSKIHRLTNTCTKTGRC